MGRDSISLESLHFFVIQREKIKKITSICETDKAKGQKKKIGVFISLLSVWY